VAAAHDETEFRQDYWNNRQTLKTTLLEWMKLAFWELVERWKSPAVAGARLSAERPQIYLSPHPAA
jgi:hypothetical protein